MLLDYSVIKVAFVGINLLPCLILLNTITFKKDVDPFSPLSFILLNVILGMTLRSIYMVINPSSWKVKNHLLIDQDYSFFIVPSIVMTVGIYLLTLGFSLKLPRINFYDLKILNYDNWKKVNLTLVIAFLSIIGFTFSYLFLQKTGYTDIFNLSDISKKRYGEIGGVKASYAYYRWLASLVQVAFFFYFCWYTKQRYKVFSINTVFVIILGVAAFLFPLIANVRGDAMLVILIPLMIWHYVRGLNIKVLMLPGLIAVVLVIFMTVSRQNKADDISSVAGAIGIETLLDIFVATRHYVGTPRTAHIMEAVPQELPYAYGTTMLGWLIAPIPREIWHSKPKIGLADTIVDKALHGNHKYGGVPPGIMGELYWNFGYLGIFIGMFVYGCILKVLYASFRPFLNTNLNYLIIYLFITIALGFQLPQTSINFTVIYFLKAIIPVLMVIVLLRLKV